MFKIPENRIHKQWFWGTTIIYLISICRPEFRGMAYLSLGLVSLYHLNQIMEILFLKKDNFKQRLNRIEQIHLLFVFLPMLPVALLLDHHRLEMISFYFIGALILTSFIQITAIILDWLFS